MNPAAFEDTREELIARFGGMSMSPHSIHGVWVHEGSRYEDDLLRYVVDVEDTPENREFFVDWKPTLLQRFQQLELYIASYLVDVV
jgi:hypothetical protein